jgi:hypothetical protein
MPKGHSGLTLPLHAIVFMEHLTTLDVEPRDQDSTVKSLAAVKSEQAEEKAAREKVQAKVETLTRAVEDLKKTTNMFVSQVPCFRRESEAFVQQGVELGINHQS